MANRIQIRGMGRHAEDLAAGTITPGMLLELDSNHKVVAHNTEGEFHERAFALEDALQGGTIDDDYSSGDLCTYMLAAPGDTVLAWLDTGESCSKGDLLISAGNGRLIKASSIDSLLTVKQNVAVAEQAITGSGSAQRLEVRVL